MKFNSKLYKLAYQDKTLVTADTLKCAEEFADIFDDKVCFAQIGKNIFLVMEYDGTTDVETLKKEFETLALETLSVPPDFNTTVLDNGMGLVMTVDSLFTVVDQSLFDYDRGIPIGLALECRCDALEACKNLVITAIAIPKHTSP